VKSALQSIRAVGHSRPALIEYFISGHLSALLGVAKNHMTVRGICELMDKVIGPDNGAGRIGGKAAGMLLAMSILNPVLTGCRARHRRSGALARSSYFIRSDVDGCIQRVQSGASSIRWS
jgi:hypothetical protein